MASTPSFTPAAVAKARYAVLAIFFINGVGLASWFPHIPAVKERLALSESVLGLALLSMAAGALLAMPVMGWLLPRLGSRRMTAIMVMVFSVALLFPVVAPNLPLLMLALLCFGASSGALDVSMNAHAVIVERAGKSTMMPVFHGFFSLGGLAGAAATGVLIGIGVTPTQHVIGTVLLLLVAALFAWQPLLPEVTGKAVMGPSLARPTGPLVGLGLLAFLALFGEGAMADWSALYLRGVLGTSAAFAATGYAAFSLAMAVGRLIGGVLVNRFGALILMRASATLAAVGLGIGLLVAHPLAAVIGFACVGLGGANLIPILFSAAGRTPGINTGPAIAAVATTGYCGFLVGPPLIGAVAETLNLTLALGLVVFGMALIAVFARAAVVKEPEPSAVRQGVTIKP